MKNMVLALIATAAVGLIAPSMPGTQRPEVEYAHRIQWAVEIDGHLHEITSNVAIKLTKVDGFWVPHEARGVMSPMEATAGYVQLNENLFIAALLDGGVPKTRPTQILLNLPKYHGYEPSGGSWDTSARDLLDWVGTRELPVPDEPRPDLIAIFDDGKTRWAKDFGNAAKDGTLPSGAEIVRGVLTLGEPDFSSPPLTEKLSYFQLTEKEAQKLRCAAGDCTERIFTFEDRRGFKRAAGLRHSTHRHADAQTGR